MNAFIHVLLLLISSNTSVLGGHKCVWVHGTVKCRKDPSRNLNVEVRVYDRDGISLARVFDPDDLMGVTFTNEDGSFQLDGCGDDFDWIPGIANDPEPYVQILHYCNDEQGEIVKLPTFKVFVPQTYEMGIVNLDDPVEVRPSRNITE